MFLDDKPQGKPGERDTGPKVLKLSDVVRECGYEKFSNPDECVLGRAFRKATGLSVFQAYYANDPRIPAGDYQAAVSYLYAVPIDICRGAETQCMQRVPAGRIADWLEARGY